MNKFNFCKDLLQEKEVKINIRNLKISFKFQQKRLCFKKLLLKIPKIKKADQNSNQLIVLHKIKKKIIIVKKLRNAKKLVKNKIRTTKNNTLQTRLNLNIQDIKKEQKTGRNQVGFLINKVST